MKWSSSTPTTCAASSDLVTATCSTVVERLVVPQIDREIETYTLPSLHNPIRAATIDGEQAGRHDFISDEIVTVPVADIIRIARTLPPVEDSDW